METAPSAAHSFLHYCSGLVSFDTAGSPQLMPKATLTKFSVLAILTMLPFHSSSSTGSLFLFSAYALFLFTHARSSGVVTLKWQRSKLLLLLAGKGTRDGKCDLMESYGIETFG